MKRINVLLILVILVGLPAFAWYFLYKGTDMRKEAMKELKIKSELNNIQLTLHNDSLISNQNLLGKRWLISLLPADEKQSFYLQQLQGLYKQSKNDFTPNFISLVGLAFGVNQNDWMKDQKISLSNDWLISFMNSNHMAEFSEKAFSLPKSLLNKPTIILLDENNQIRKIVDMTDQEQIKIFAAQYPVFLSLKLKHE